VSRLFRKAPINAKKNVGHGAVAEIIRARDEGGQFTSLADFITRVNNRLVNKKVWESLTKAGAFDRFAERGALLEHLDTILAVAAKLNKEQKVGQTDLFGDSDEVTAPKILIEVPTGTGIYSEHEYLQWERELLGLYLSSHPLEAFDSFLTEQTVLLAEVIPENDGKTAVVGGTINDIRQITTKNGQPMAFVKLEDIVGDERELVVFPTVFKDTTDVWNKEKIILVTAKVNGTDKTGVVMQEAKLLVDSARIVTPDEAKAYAPTGARQSFTTPKARVRKAARAIPSNGHNPSTTQKAITENSAQARLYIRLKDASDSSTLEQLKGLLDEHTGNHEAVLVLGESKKQIIKLPQLVSDSTDLVMALKNLVGEEQVKFQ
jgi:DNA polymerase-3 subunit alpha